MTSLEPATANLGGGGSSSGVPPPVLTADPPQDESGHGTSRAALETQSNNTGQHESHDTSANDAVPQEQSLLATNEPNVEDNRSRQALDNLMAALIPKASSNQQTSATDPSQQHISPVTNAILHVSSDNHDVATANELLPSLLPTVTADPTLINGAALSYDLPPNPFEDIFDAPLQEATLPLSYSDMGPMTARDGSRKIGAFAKLSFDDGHFFMCTYSMELGRDVIAYQDAQRREAQAQDGLQLRAQNSSSRRSRHSDRIKRGMDSQIPGSIVSESGGFAGLDHHRPGSPNASGDKRNSYPSHSSQRSDIIAPSQILLSNPFDYAKRVEEVAAFENDNFEDGERPAPVTAEHMPNPNICPLIPIHATTDSDDSEVMVHRRISRRHVRIEWSEADECFVLQILGRNGAFLDGEWCKMHTRKRLKDGSVIQIAEIQILFELPSDASSSPSLPEMEGSPERPGSITPISTPDRNSPPARVSLKLTNKKSSSRTTPPAKTQVPLLGPDGQPITRKRGPGRPPKDGIMSTRERKEREKMAKAAEAKALNGGTTPPPTARGKPLKPPTKEELARMEAARQEKKKQASTAVKRKRDDDGEVMQSIEGGEELVPSDTERVLVKKPRQSKSPSPDYPPLESLTEEQLARPTDPYARLIYDLLMEIYPKALPLKQIYRAIKTKFPFFVHKVESDGWQSSVRHNLNQEWTKLFHKGEKEGKGFAWKAIPGALPAQEQRKKAAQSAAAAKPKPQQPRQQNNPMQQGAYWNSNGYAGANGGQYPPGQGPPGGQGQGRPYQSAGQNSAGAGSRTVPPQRLLFPPIGAKHMPVSKEGLFAVLRFETSMCERIKKKSVPGAIDRFLQIFDSVKARAINGAPATLVSSGESKEEKTILGRVKAIVELHPNPKFEAFDYKPPAPPATAQVTKPAAPPRPQNTGQGGPSQVPGQGVPRQGSAPLTRPANGAPPGQMPPQQMQHQGQQQPQGSQAPPQQMPQQVLGGPYPRPSQLAHQRAAMAHGNFVGQQRFSSTQTPPQRPGSASGNQVRPSTPSAPANGTAQAQRDSPYPSQPQQFQQANAPQTGTWPQAGQSPRPPSQPSQQGTPPLPSYQQHMPPQQGTAAAGNQQHMPPQQVAPQQMPPQAATQQQVSSPSLPQQAPGIQRPPQQMPPTTSSGNMDSPRPSDIAMSDAPTTTPVPATRPAPYPTVGQSMQAAAAASIQKQQSAQPSGVNVDSSNPTTTPGPATTGLKLHLGDSTQTNGQDRSVDQNGDVTVTAASAGGNAGTA